MAQDLVAFTALISESETVTFGEIAIVAAALQKQVVRDLGPIWNLRATVDPFEKLEDVPIGHWPMIVRDDIGFDAAGIHLDQAGQPFALISSSDDNDVWSLTASHEVCEMLVDPFGNRMVPGDSPKPDQGRVNFLVEVCDPSEASDFAYSVSGVLVSDFYTPAYFDPIASTSTRYSFTDAIKEPRDVLPGGYLSWEDPESGEWWQETWFGGTTSRFVNLGKLTAKHGSLRTQIDRLTSRPTMEAIARGRKSAVAAGLPVKAAKPGRNLKAESLHAQIAELTGRSKRRTRAGTEDREERLSRDSVRRRPKRFPLKY